MNIFKSTYDLLEKSDPITSAHKLESTRCNRFCDGGHQGMKPLLSSCKTESNNDQIHTGIWAKYEIENIIYEQKPA